jgi:hypothetical protein
MTEKLFSSLFTESTAITTSTFFACIIAALVIGTAMAVVYKFRNRSSQSFLVTLAVIPAAVAMVIMLVNGDFGTGVAVAGAFGLIRFRSAPGTAKEIAAIFTAMGVGLACGVGYIGYAAAFALIMCGAMLLFGMTGFGSGSADEHQKKLTVTIPENLDFSTAFDDLFEKYTLSHKLVNVKTTNMGSLFKLSYDVELKSDASEKGFIDELRCRNGNLEISLHRQESNPNEL